ncbi:hypothetical protein Ndes2526B_g04279 [Nannochloris sp. 'desiccata']
MPALTPLSGESLASVVPEGLDDTASSVEASPTRRGKKKYGFGKRFAYQQLRGWRPILSAHNAELFLLAAGTLLLALGIPILVAALGVKEYSVRYDNAGPMAGLSREQQQQAIWAAPDIGVVYDLAINVEERMEPPIYVVFELGDFHQNYRRYVRSYDGQQMHDGSPMPGMSACAPFRYQGATDDANDSLPENGAILPCGQIAHSFFNDSYALALNGQGLAIDDTNIAWSGDKDHLYGDVLPINYNIEPAYRGGNTSTVPLNQNEHWMVWQRPGGRTPVQKLYGKIDQPIPEGSSVQLTVSNKYNTYSFGGSKRVILSTNSWVGGRNMFFAGYLPCTGRALLFGCLVILRRIRSRIHLEAPSWYRG